ncbi:MAG TPA: mechanosensitive ion channel family protein [Balneolaceae bacterium]
MENFRDVMQGYWEQFLEFSPLFVLGLLVIAVSIFFAIWISASVYKSLSKRMDDPLLVHFLSRLIKGFLIVIGLFLALQLMGFGGIAAGLLASAGLSAFVIGFALKDIIENFLAGIILSFDRPFNLNDTINVNNLLGNVTSLDFRTTKIKTFDGKDVFIPNATILKQSLTNYTRDGLARLELMVALNHGDDIQRAKFLITASLLSFDEILKKNPPYVIIDEFTTDAINLRAFFWTSTFDYRKEINVLKGEVTNAIKEALQAEGYSIRGVKSA